MAPEQAKLLDAYWAQQREKPASGVQKAEELGGLAKAITDVVKTANDAAKAQQEAAKASNAAAKAQQDAAKRTGSIADGSPIHQ